MHKFLGCSFLAIMLLTSGCSSVPKFNKIELGMTEDQTIELLGEPESIAVQGNSKYHEYASWWGLSLNEYQLWYVRFIDGVVESFGRRGDFDSTKDATQNINIQIDDISDKNQTDEYDLELNLNRLQQLRDKNLISKDEFQALRKRAVDKGVAF